ncbi:uncharacterized protein LOC127837148 [Dreissena polymorpha]|uniref:Uncharacterized protein n=1 Tax=Dreissena polymorpha TaxID=45954 RepID=A0A9D4MV79_DREPO|nr:uncharacterized protein LOC127837148 [Dreissena polymorpha]KAH3884403.1 hypothetical protein DPMN_008381 [Dreissena polymorpha]
MMIRLLIFLLVVSWTQVTTRSTTPDPSGYQIIDGICLGKRSDRLIYRHRNDTHIFIAFDILKSGTVDVYTWQLVQAKTGTFIYYDVKIATVPAIDFRKQVRRSHVIGACGRRHQKLFEHRVERKMKHCKKLAKEKRREKKRLCKVRAVANIFVRMKIRNASFDNENGCDA